MRKRARAMIAGAVENANSGSTQARRALKALRASRWQNAFLDSLCRGENGRSARRI
jgi:hypothetical protein